MAGTLRALLVAALACLAFEVGDLAELTEAEAPFGTDTRLIGLALAALVAAVVTVPPLPFAPVVATLGATPATWLPPQVNAAAPVRHLRVRGPPR